MAMVLCGTFLNNIVVIMADCSGNLEGVLILRNMRHFKVRIVGIGRHCVVPRMAYDLIIFVHGFYG